MSYQDANAAAVDRWVAAGWEWGRPIDHATFASARDGDWSILLTPSTPVPDAWWPELEGARVLGLACGGAQQMPLLTAAGAHCTVLDYSESQLASEREVAEREGYDIDVVRADMTRPLPFGDGIFDLVVNPVSICFVREVGPLWHEVARVLTPGGVFLTGFGNDLDYIVDESEERVVHGLPFDPVENPDDAAELERDDAGMQFSHGIGQTVGGIARAGLVIDDVIDDLHTEGRLHDMGIPLFEILRAHKPAV
jgi:SAM-dependent methyltransferase